MATGACLPTGRRAFRKWKEPLIFWTPEDTPCAAEAAKDTIQIILQYENASNAALQKASALNFLEVGMHPFLGV